MDHNLLNYNIKEYKSACQFSTKQCICMSDLHVIIMYLLITFVAEHQFIIQSTRFNVDKEELFISLRDHIQIPSYIY